MRPGDDRGSRLKRWTLQELLAVVYPYCTAATSILILTIYWFQKDLSALLYSSLPETYKTRLWFTLCFLQEVNLLLYSWFSIGIIFQLHILLPGKLSRVLKLLAESSKRCCGRAAEARAIIQKMRTIQLVVGLFNVGHRHVIYCVKLVCITIATVNGYGAIAHGKGNPVYFLQVRRGPTGRI